MRVSFLLAGFITICCPFLLRAQETNSVTINKNTHRPVVKNNRVLWFEYNDSNVVNPSITLYLYENGGSKSITEDASALFTGWPDLDDQGNIAFTRYIGSQHEVILYDGKKETRITNNPQIRNSTIDMGRGSAKVTTGHARIHDGNIVFRDKTGHIYLYQKKNKAILKITSLPAHTANLGDYALDKTQAAFGIPLNAHVKQFDFDGSFITWMHEMRGYGMESSVTLIQADISEDFTPRVISRFDAWVPSSKSVMPKLLDPFFSACNGKVIWQFYKPGPPPPAGMPDLLKNYSANLDDTRVWFFDGYSTKEIYQGSFVAPQSVKMDGGRATWWHVRKEKDGKKTNKFDEIYLHQNGNNVRIASYPQPPSNAALKNTEWSGIWDVEVVGEDIYWVMGQVECFDQMKIPQINGTNELVCLYQPTNQVGFFRRSFGQRFAFRKMDTKMYSGGGEEDRGLYAFFSTRGRPGVRDISTMRLFGGADTTTTILSLIDRKKPDLQKKLPDFPDSNRVIDVFSINNNSIISCGNTDTLVTLTLKSITLEISAEKLPNARLEDIRSVALFVDNNDNGAIDDDDREVGRKISPNSSIYKITPGFPEIKIKQGEPKNFLVELLLKDDVCPCSRFKVTVRGENVIFKETADTPTGSSMGEALLPEAIVNEEAILGDAQAGLPKMVLPEKLVVVYKNFPVRCGKAQFKITGALIGQSAQLTGSNGTKDTVQIVQDFVQEGRDARSEVTFQLGKKEGQYNITASVKNPPGITCENQQYIFKEHSGKMIVQLIDLNNQNYYNSSQDNSNPDYITWKTTMTEDMNQLAKGGNGREGAVADGASMLLIRLQLLGPPDPPAGDIKLTINGEDHIGHLSKGLGEVVPTYSGGTSLTVQWKKTEKGVFAFALYTPPLNYGDIFQKRRNVKLVSTYTLPGAKEPLEVETDFKLVKPTVALVHGFSSNSDTWGDNFLLADPTFEKVKVEYGPKAAGSFRLLGSVIKNEIAKIINNLRNQKIAATRVNVIAHSMGGMLVRQHFADNSGLNYHRKDNFGQGDIYKFISIGVPHWGSPLSWLSHEAQKYTAGIQIVKLLKGVGMDVNAGGLAAMCPGSDALLGLGNTYIRTHAISTWFVDPRAETSLWDYVEGQVKKFFKAVYNLQFDDAFFAALGIVSFINILRWALTQVLNVGIMAFYSGDRSDMLVTLVSQRAGITQYKNFDNVLHMSFEKPVKDNAGGWLTFSDLFQTTNGKIADYVYQTLNKDIDNINIFAKMLPKPSVQDPNITCK